jgi:NTP pyrophosphatase (non-canonical NTP hydrolase)
MNSQLEKLSELVDNFCEERDWKQFHNIKDLAMGLSIEASELLQIFLWKDSKEVEALLDTPNKREDIEDEVADVLFFLLRIAHLNNIDLQTALEKKITKNELKYPVSKFKGSNKKYNEIQDDRISQK